MSITLSRWIKRLVYCLLLLCTAIFLTDFIINNDESVQLKFFQFPLYTLSVSSIIVIFFVLGGLIGLLSSSIMLIKLTLSNASLKRELKRQNTTIQNFDKPHA
ncbi:MAG: LapA family protein [Endozoicomonadaceae bacterium]|nr:LapA family protein [Endozoicomonadaceae bacterium]